MTHPRIKQISQPTLEEISWFLHAAGITAQKLADLADFCSDELQSSVVEISDQASDVTIDHPVTATLYDILFPLKSLVLDNTPLHGTCQIIFTAGAETIPISSSSSVVLFAWSALNQDGTPHFTAGSTYCLSMRFCGDRTIVSAANLYTVQQTNS